MTRKELRKIIAEEVNKANFKILSNTLKKLGWSNTFSLINGLFLNIRETAIPNYFSGMQGKYKLTDEEAQSLIEWTALMIDPQQILKKIKNVFTNPNFHGVGPALLGF